MKRLIYVGGDVKGHEFNVGDPFTFVTQRDFNELGITIKLNCLWNLKYQEIVYVTANEMVECFEMVS